MKEPSNEQIEIPDNMIPWGMEVPFGENEQKKLMAILEAKFSLHEADELYASIFNPDTDEDSIKWQMEYWAKLDDGSDE
jgi:hypothetical protein